MMITSTLNDALDSLAQVATDQLFAFEPSFFTPQLARQVPLSDDFVTGMDEPTNIFGEPIDFHDTSVAGTYPNLARVQVVYLGSSRVRVVVQFGYVGSLTSYSLVNLELTLKSINSVTDSALYLFRDTNQGNHSSPTCLSIRCSKPA